jgi:hypothetical protein
MDTVFEASKKSQSIYFTLYQKGLAEDATRLWNQSRSGFQICNIQWLIGAVVHGNL